MQELLPFQIPHWSVSTKKGLNIWLREQFNIPAPRDNIERLNQGAKMKLSDDGLKVICMS